MDTSTTSSTKQTLALAVLEISLAVLVYRILAPRDDLPPTPPPSDLLDDEIVQQGYMRLMQDIADQDAVSRGRKRELKEELKGVRR